MPQRAPNLDGTQENKAGSCRQATSTTDVSDCINRKQAAAKSSTASANFLVAFTRKHLCILNAVGVFYLSKGIKTSYMYCETGTENLTKAEKVEGNTSHRTGRIPQVGHPLA